MQFTLLSALCLLFVLSTSAFRTAFTNPAFRITKSLALEARISGKVKFFDSVKGYGFIVPDDGTPDLFVHQTTIHARGYRSLGEGETVEFDVNEDAQRNKRFASNVTGPNGEYVIGGTRPNDQRSSRPSNGGYSSDRQPRGYNDDFGDQ